MTSSLKMTAQEVLQQHRLSRLTELYGIGIFDSAVTVLSQQIRALNLAWALIETGTVDPESEPRIAIVGAGFSGLTFAAGLMSKGVKAKLTIIEARDSVLPLQKGSDTRWLHPHIYDWPADGSQASSAGLPVVNWTAARASDVAVQAEAAWVSLVRNRLSNTPLIELHCNAARTRVDVDSRGKPWIEWVGQERKPDEPSTPLSDLAQRGQRRQFDFVVMSSGFGSEIDGNVSYWRNETLGQPALDKSRTEYVVSGHGDGGLIDLFRIRIMSYRQDRILGELFAGKPAFIDELRTAQSELVLGQSAVERFEDIWSRLNKDARDVELRLRRRLRHDTWAIMQLRRNEGFTELFTGRRVSFQNQLLAWMLFSVGGFELRVGNPEAIVATENIDPAHVVLRHGALPIRHLLRTLGGKLHEEVEPLLDKDLDTSSYQQTDNTQWSAGYFDQRLGARQDSDKAHWSREYLPASTELASAAMCGAVAGFLRPRHSDRRLRVTFHRRLPVGKELALQQCCDYEGVGLPDQEKTASRAFPHSQGILGQAFSSGQVVRSKLDVTQGDLQDGMKSLHVGGVSRQMAQEVLSLLAVPCIDEASMTVFGVLFLDSFEAGFFGDDVAQDVVDIAYGALSAIARNLDQGFDTLANVPYWDHGANQAPALLLDANLEFVQIDPPCVPLARLNIDVASFVEAGAA